MANFNEAHVSMLDKNTVYQPIQTRIPSEKKYFRIKRQILLFPLLDIVLSTSIGYFYNEIETFTR